MSAPPAIDNSLVTRRLQISLRSLLARFKSQVSLTWFLVIVEGGLYLAIPMFIGQSLDDLSNNSHRGLVELASLCGALLSIGGLRRYYDTRVYGNIYRTVATELVIREKNRHHKTSTISARTQLFGEFIEFLEYSIPEICHNLINLCGTLVIIALISNHLLLLCLTASVISAMIYWFTGNRLLALNRGQNDELERQVELIGTETGTQIFNHFKQLMGWRICLSDLETLNFTGI